MYDISIHIIYKVVNSIGVGLHPTTFYVHRNIITELLLGIPRYKNNFSSNPVQYAHYTYKNTILYKTKRTTGYMRVSVLYFRVNIL